MDLNKYYMYERYAALLPDFLRDLEESQIAEVDEFLHDIYDDAHMKGYNEGFYFGH